MANVDLPRSHRRLHVGTMADALRPTIGARPLDYPSYIFLISFVFLNSLLFCLISTVLWGSATSICDGIIEIPIVHWRCKFRFSEKILPWLGLGWEIYSLCSQIQSLSYNLLQKQRGITQVKKATTDK